MNALQKVFSYEGRQVRTTIANGQVWFVAKDVCEILELGNVTRAVERLSGAQKGLTTVQTLGGNQQANIVSEAGLYKLVFTSRKPEAERFTDWVAEEVLPAIRQTGGYVATGREEEFIDTYFPTLSEATKIAMVKDLQRSVKEMKPKADYFDALVERNLLTNFRDTAKQLKIRQSDFMTWLEEKGFIYRDTKDNPKPYARYTPDLFEIKEFTKGKYAGTQTLVTPKGREAFRLLLEEVACDVTAS